MSEEILFDYLHSEVVSYCLNDKVRHLFAFLHEILILILNFQENDLANLEYIGYTTGYRIIERLTRDYPRFKDELDTMKFICTDFWSSIYKKQIDNLRTNHQGVYVLQDNSFRFLNKLSTGSQYLEHAPKVRRSILFKWVWLTFGLNFQYVAFTCGLLRGSLANLGINSIVTAEVSSLPACKFHIQVSRV